MKLLRFFATLLLATSSFAQANISPFASLGYGNFLTRTGLSEEIGFMYHDRSIIGCTLSYRHFYGKQSDYLSDEVRINSLNIWFNFKVLDTSKWQLVLGSGVVIYHLDLSDLNPNDLIGYSKDYSALGIGIGSIECRRKLNEKWMAGLKYWLTPEDGDVTETIGLSIYRPFKVKE